MNTGIISSRYSTALLRFSDENGDTEKVLSQAKILETALSTVPTLSRYLVDPSGVAPSQKMTLLRAAVGDEPLATSLESFLSLVIHNGREAELRFMLHSFISRYYKSRNIRFASLTTASDAPEWLENKIRDAMERLYGGTFIVEETVDPSIIGGLVMTVDDYKLDASVANRLKFMRKEFNDKNNRIV